MIGKWRTIPDELQLSAVQLYTQGQRHVVNHRALVRAELASCGVHSQPAERVAKVGHEVAAGLASSHEHIDESTVGVLHWRSHADIPPRAHSAAEQRREVVTQ